MSYKREIPQPVTESGTGVTTMVTAYAPVCAGTTATSALQVASTGLSSSGYVLTSNGSSSLPSFQISPGNLLSIINGDSGAVTASTDTLQGSISGAVFTGSGSTITESFNYLTLPTTTSANGQITINGLRFMYAYGTANAFLGSGSGNFTLTGTDLVGIGKNTLKNVTSSTGSVAIGYNSVASTLAAAIVGIGSNSLNAAGGTDTAIGAGSGQLVTSGGGNVLIGYQSGNNILTGAYNIPIGYQAGINYTSSESHNILINNPGVVADSHTLRIGADTGTGTQQLNKSFIHGIRGTTTVNNNAIAVLIDSAGQLGTVSSSIRHKENVEDMGNMSASVLSLRPVTFDFINKPNHKKQVGLIAEEVNNSMPLLVAYNQDGEIESVKYHDLSSLLLNELQKLLYRIELLENVSKL